ncbi:hypothetical protein HUJ05_012461 [Dendroctonus ponderosae]|nr:hypothetical protein HUJ05_012461 [Dendroctonus ponderosae]
MRPISCRIQGNPHCYVDADKPVNQQISKDSSSGILNYERLGLIRKLKILEICAASRDCSILGQNQISEQDANDRRKQDKSTGEKRNSPRSSKLPTDCPKN